MTEEGSGARLVRNTLANGLGSFSAVAIALILTPFMIHRLGAEQYGVWVLALTFTFFGGYAALSDLGVELATVRYIAEARGAHDPDEFNRTVSTSLAFFAIVGVIGALAVLALSIPFVHLFGIRPGARSAAEICFGFVGLQLAFELPARAFIAVLEGTQNYILFQAVELTRAIAQAVLFITVLLAGRGVGMLGAALAVSSLIALALSWRLAHRVAPELRVRRSLVGRDVLKRLLRYGGSLVSLRVLGTIYNQMDKVIVGIALGTRFVTVYEVANKIERGASMVQTISASALWPTAAGARDNRELVRDVYLRGTSYAVGVSVPVAAAALALAHPLIRSWVGRGFGGSVLPTQLFLVLLTLISVHVVGTATLVARGVTRPIIAITGVGVAINLVASILLVSPLGVKGVVLGSVIGQAVAWVPLQRLFLKRFEVGLREWIANVPLPLVPALAVQAVVTVPLVIVLHGSTVFPLVALGVLVSAAAGVAGFAFAGLRGAARRQLLITLRAAVGLRPKAPAEA